MEVVALRVKHSSGHSSPNCGLRISVTIPEGARYPGKDGLEIFMGTAVESSISMAGEGLGDLHLVLLNAGGVIAQEARCGGWQGRHEIWNMSWKGPYK
jgi:hypothetical protein